MPFPKKNLNPNETVALDMHPHWWYFAEAAALLAVSIIVGLFIAIGMDSGSVRTGLGWIDVAFIVGSAIWLIVRYCKWVTTNFVITSDRIIFRQGFISKSGIEIPLERVNNVNFRQGIFERMLGAGDLLIESGGEDGQQRFTDVRKPQSVQNLIHAQAEAKSRYRSGFANAAPAATAPAAPSQNGVAFAPPPPVVDVPAQLEKLEGLLQRGTISQEEFDLQKHRLLGT